MSRAGSTAARRRRTSRPQLAGRDAFESALESIQTMEPKTPKDSIASEYLPRYVAKLRELKYTQDDIVTTIVALNLGVTERQIRSADSAWVKAHPKERAASANGTGGGGAPGRESGSEVPSTTGGTGGTSTPHAGLGGSRALKR